MPNAYVFPGGLVDPSDFSGEWLDVFGEGPPLFGLRGVRQAPETRPPIFATDRVKLGSPIPGEVAFRICALRETFEESGVLIAVPQEEGPRSTHLCSAHQVPDEVPDICRSELSRWRTLVNEDPSNFVRMCKELQVLPNIWALHEWSNWLTPAGRYGVSRFDTAFFICCLRQTPHALHDQKEIVKFQVTPRPPRAPAGGGARPGGALMALCPVSVVQPLRRPPQLPGAAAVDRPAAVL